MPLVLLRQAAVVLDLQNEALPLAEAPQGHMPLAAGADAVLHRVLNHRLEDKPGAGAKVELLQLLPKVQALGLPLQQAYCYWTDGRYMLLGDGYYFAFYDSQENKGLDLQPLLLSDGSAELLNQFLLKSAPQVYNEAELSAFWQRIRLPENTDDEVSRPWLHYDHCTEGVFYFELHYISYAHAPHRNGGSYTVSLGLQQLKEML